MAPRLLALALILASGLKAAVPEAINIPRHASRTYATEGLYEGGSDVRANLERIDRLPYDDQGGFERWVFEFSDVAARAKGKVAPRFQLEYLPAQRISNNDDTEKTIRPARLRLSLRALARNYVSPSSLSRLAKSSRFVKEVVFYPPIEEGDQVLELVLSHDVLFSPHQPMDKAGRLVVDLK